MFPDNQSESGATSLVTLYDSIWSHARACCETNSLLVDPAPDEGNPRWGISAVFRVKGLKNLLGQVGADLIAYLGFGHIVFDDSNTHLTLASIEKYRKRVLENDARVRLYLDVYKSLLKGATPLKILCSGLTSSRSGVLVQGWPVDGTLQQFRLRSFEMLNDALRKAFGEPVGFDAPRQSFHITFVLFAGPLEQPADFVSFIDQHRRTEFGLAILDRLEIVRYLRLPKAVKLKTLGAVELSAAPAQ